jgi:8-oxo-dGTP pyrophosphatase MutT (NUDIX family)|tara:strand:+ start:502 stop:918 length:417 start_codon:yes stop_codon:yes gene_type:complete
MKKQKSCGLILFTREKDTKFLLLHYKHGHWSFIKGHVEEGELDKETVSRETKEETGITDFSFIEGFKEDINYTFKESNKTIFKEVTFYLAETKEKDVRLSDEHIGYEWLGFDDALRLLSFNDTKALLKKANILIKTSK